MKWKLRLSMINRDNIPRIKNLKRCIKYHGITREKIFYNTTDELKPLVRYTGIVWSIRKIYKPFRTINIQRIEIEM